MVWCVLFIAYPSEQRLSTLFWVKYSRVRHELLFLHPTFLRVFLCNFFNISNWISQIERVQMFHVYLTTILNLFFAIVFYRIGKKYRNKLFGLILMFFSIFSSKLVAVISGSDIILPTIFQLILFLFVVQFFDKKIFWGQMSIFSNII
jgi:hypothetical protein